MIYQAGPEEEHNQKRLQTKTLAIQMSDSARDHKTRQDDLLRKNAQLRDQLMNLRRNLVEAKRIQLEEHAQFEERVHQKNQKIQAVTQESLQLTTEKRVVEARLQLQADTEKELKMEKDIQVRVEA